MSVDSEAYIPPDVELYDIQVVIARAFGYSVTRSEHGGVDIDFSNIGKLPQIKIRSTFTVDTTSTAFYYIGHIPFFYCSRYEGRVMSHLQPSSQADMLAVLRKVARAFGGIVIPKDSSSNVEERYPRPPVTTDGNGFTPTNGELWYKYNDYLASIKPITSDELLKAIEDCAYGEFSHEEWANEVLAGKYDDKSRMKRERFMSRVDILLEEQAKNRGVRR